MESVITFNGFKNFFDKIFTAFFTKSLFVKTNIKFNNNDFVYIDEGKKTINLSDFVVKQNDEENEEIIETEIEKI